MKKLALLIALLAVCGCYNRITVSERSKGDASSVLIPDDQVLASMESDISATGSVVVIRWEKKEK